MCSHLKLNFLNVSWVADPVPPMEDVVVRGIWIC